MGRRPLSMPAPAAGAEEDLLRSAQCLGKGVLRFREADLIEEHRVDHPLSAGDRPTQLAGTPPRKVPDGPHGIHALVTGQAMNRMPNTSGGPGPSHPRQVK